MKVKIKTISVTTLIINFIMSLIISLIINLIMLPEVVPPQLKITSVGEVTVITSEGEVTSTREVTSAGEVTSVGEVTPAAMCWHVVLGHTSIIKPKLYADGQYKLPKQIEKNNKRLFCRICVMGK